MKPSSHPLCPKATSSSWTISPAHKSARAEAAIRVKGAWLLDLPPYSPHRNPIEMAFSKMKAPLGAGDGRTIDDVWHAIGDICALYQPAECANCCKAAGYAYV